MPTLRWSGSIKGVRTSSELVKRLTALHEELAATEQGAIDVSSLDAIRRELIAPSSLMHKDRTVKAYIACCLADMLRLYAPDAPYTPAELRDIFQFFVRQLRNLGSAKVEASNVVQYHYLLQSLAEIKSIALVAELPGHEEIMTEFFRELFDVIRCG